MKPNPNDPAFLGALVYFDRAARSQSFAAAADSLNVTPSAVSHRIAALEESLGQRLFLREVRQVRLTPEGVQLARATAEAIAGLRDACEQLTRTRVLRVSVGPYLSSMWLMGRIGDFEARHAGLRVDLDHRIGATSGRNADVAIVWEDVAPRPRGHRNLFDTMSVPVAAPGVAARAPFWESDVPPIHYRDRRPWRHWLRAAGAPVKYADRGDVLDDPNLVFEAAAHGRGIAIGFLPFIAGLFASGRLVAVSDFEQPAQRTYRVAVHKSGNPLAREFADWLVQQARSTLPALKPN